MPPGWIRPNCSTTPSVTTADLRWRSVESRDAFVCHIAASWPEYNERDAHPSSGSEPTNQRCADGLPYMLGEFLALLPPKKKNPGWRSRDCNRLVDHADLPRFGAHSRHNSNWSQAIEVPPFSTPAHGSARMRPDIRAHGARLGRAVDAARPPRGRLPASARHGLLF